ncbi:MAG TPA: DUF4126 domain-containing protein [Desulfobacterales bacterium]|nr:DUF4126 domain-containing protein [Desulfobacterales bacterium]
MDILTGLGLAVPAGLNAYIPLLTVAVAERMGWIELAEPYALLGEWWAIALIAVLLLVEMVADKVPAVDSVNDAVQTAVRPAAGGLLTVAAAGGEGALHPAAWVVAGVLVAGSVHAAKATARPAITASTGGLGTPVVSLVEDLIAFATTIVALVAPVLVGLIVVALAVVFVRVRRRRREGPSRSAGP